jgi:hypothetical protein
VQFIGARLKKLNKFNYPEPGLTQDSRNLRIEIRAKTVLFGKKLGMLKQLIPLFFMLFFMAGCYGRPSNALNAGRTVNFTSCALPKDQGVGSLHGKWTALPVPIVFDRDFYVADNGEIMPALRGALQSWNRWAELRGMQAFSIKNDGSGASAGREIPDLTDCAQASYSSSVTDMVGIWKINSFGTHRNQRPSCGTLPNGDPGRILPYAVQGQTDWIIQSGRIIGASILLNFEDYNTIGKQRVDVESLLLHELGHVLGLLHSCNGSSGDSTDSTTSPPCANANPLYTSAVMFPFLQLRQERRSLKQNDYNRINCLY